MLIFYTRRNATEMNESETCVEIATEMDESEAYVKIILCQRFWDLEFLIMTAASLLNEDWNVKL